MSFSSPVDIVNRACKGLDASAGSGAGEPPIVGRHRYYAQAPVREQRQSPDG
jgi:hypothetical protein